MEPKIAVIVAKAKGDHGIGCSDGLPWHIPDELKYFKKITMGKPVIMGRKTYASIINQYGKPLPGRKNIVVSRSGYEHDNAIVYNNLNDAMQAAKDIATKDSMDEFFIIGGEQIFKQAIPMADIVYLTQIKSNCPKVPNAFLYDEDLKGWQIESKETKSLLEKNLGNFVECEFQVLLKKSTK